MDGLRVAFDAQPAEWPRWPLRPVEEALEEELRLLCLASPAPKALYQEEAVVALSPLCHLPQSKERQAYTLPPVSLPPASPLRFFFASSSPPPSRNLSACAGTGSLRP